MNADLAVRLRRAGWLIEPIPWDSHISSDRKRAVLIKRPVGPMTLIELRDEYTGLFYRNQDWFRDEAFMRVLPNERDPKSPTHIVRAGKVPKSSKGLPLAVDLANAYVRDPMNPVFDDYLWCRDVDAQGQRIYVGGLANRHGFEIHRHIHVSARFGVPVWR